MEMENKEGLVYSYAKDCYVSKEEYENEQQVVPFDCGNDKHAPAAALGQWYGHANMALDDNVRVTVMVAGNIIVQCWFCKRVHEENLQAHTFSTVTCSKCTRSFCKDSQCYEKHVKPRDV